MDSILGCRLIVFTTYCTSYVLIFCSGWHVSLAGYRDKIYSTLRQMHEECKSALPANHIYISHYLDYYWMRSIEGVLRSIKPLPQGFSKDPKLLELVNSMTTIQEQRLAKDLSTLSYVIKSTADVLLIAGSERIETVSACYKYI